MCSKGSKQKPSFNLLKQLKPMETKVRFADDKITDTDEAIKLEKEIKKEKKKRPRSEKEAAEAEEKEKKKERISGLEATVKEMLANYKPSSAEKRPFWCRICRLVMGLGLKLGLE
jgi:DNA-binding MltR family transcriptional regulator